MASPGNASASVGLNEKEKEMIRSIFQLGETTAREIMVPRTEVIAVAEKDNINDITNIVTQYGHSRIPVYKENLDHISGILHVKDLLKCVDRNCREMDPSHPITFFMRPPLIVSENRKIDILFQEMKKKHKHIAVVVDEYGGTAGIVTLEDILEEIVGEIHDEYDKEEELFNRVDADTVELDPKISLTDLNPILVTPLLIDNPDYDTLSGLIFNTVGAIPAERDEISVEGLKITILKMDGQRIERVRVKTLLKPQ